ncbi:MAG: hypothetical protein JWL85_999 [Candidatus Saccharibacteria bacterium]|nr:hypothetical protein [Candidatus Saccharibacteria bacterium]
MLGTPGRIRTYDLWLRKPTLYPAELRVHIGTYCKVQNSDEFYQPLVIQLVELLFSTLPLKGPAELRVHI